MRFVIQRVQHAEVKVDGEVTGSIGKGFLVLIGVAETDTREIADKMIKKLLGLRIFEDAQGKTNLDLHAVEGELLLVSQFTLYADCKKGRRPSFSGAARPETAILLYQRVVEQAKAQGIRVATGEFGAEMTVSIENDGPVTILLDTDEIMPLKGSHPEE